MQSVELSTGGDMQSATRFVDKAVGAAFEKFHTKHAKLDIFKKFER